ncbi:MAG: hypothetical protein KDK89_06460 [Alphaproteobacteria bacterium]|nr:hypothetical protein [Alphaproteobacteria bacterium]
MPGVRVTVLGDLEKELVAEVRGAERAVTAAIRLAGAEVKTGWRAQIASAGLGERLGRTIRDQYYPKGEPSLGAAALVYSKAPHIVGAFDEGVVIRSKEGFWLAIPTSAAGKSSTGGRITPGEWERRNGRRLKLVYRRGRPGLLVDTGDVLPRARVVKRDGTSRAARGFRNRSVIVFVLVPQARLRKRLDLESVAREWQDRLAGLVIQNWPDLKAETTR